MKAHALKFSKKFYRYQKERFPIIALGVSLFPAILSSGVIVSSNPSIFKAILAVIASLAYLLHIRVIDEHRDFHHDNLHHPSRPIQVGLISKDELKRIDFCAIMVLLIIGAYSGIHTTFLAVIMLIYSYLAGKEFFFGEKIRRYFFTYNAVNIIQMLLMQIFVYLTFTQTLTLTALLIAHFLFTTVGTITFEFVRKVKIPGEDGTGKDTYTWHLGFGNSLIIYWLLSTLNIFLFLRVAFSISSRLFPWLIVCVFLGTIIALSSIIHWSKREKLTDTLLQFSFLFTYSILNLIICFIGT